MAKEQVLRTLAYVSMIKLTEVMHELADQIQLHAPQNMSKPIERVHEDLEAGLYVNLQTLIDHKNINMGLVDMLNDRVSQIRAKIHE